jgi:hypothetical protein
MRIALPSLAGDRDVARAVGSLIALTAGGGSTVAELQRFGQLDVRHLLPMISVPTLVLHRIDDQVEPIESARYLVDRIPGARLVELPGRDAQPWAGESRAVIDEIREFLTGVRGESEPARRLATVLFTDIVGSTEHAAAMGDARWSRIVEQHDDLARATVRQFRGELVRGTGDGMLATFDGPARAIRCAQALADAVRVLGVEIRAGAHTGEITSAPATGRHRRPHRRADRRWPAPRGLGVLDGGDRRRLRSRVRDRVARAQGRAGPRRLCRVVRADRSLRQVCDNDRLSVTCSSWIRAWDRTVLPSAPRQREQKDRR